MERKRQDKAAWARFSTEEPLLDTMMARAEGQCRLRDGPEGDYIVASDPDDARRIAAGMAMPLLSLVTTKGEIIALTSNTADPDTATVSLSHDDTDIPLWVPVHPFPLNWIGESYDA